MGQCVAAGNAVNFRFDDAMIPIVPGTPTFVIPTSQYYAGASDYLESPVVSACTPTIKSLNVVP